MRSRRSRPLVDVRPLRVLALLLVLTILGGGGYVAGRAMTDGPSGPPAGSADPAASAEGARPDLTPDTPTSGVRTPPSRSGDPRATATESSETPSPTTATIPSPRTTPTTPTPPSTSTASPSTAPEDPSESPSSTRSASPTATPSPTGPTSPTASADTTPPETTVSPDSLGLDALFLVSANEPATFACSLDGAAYTACGPELRLVDLAAGWHTLAVRATDAAGNTDPTPAASRWHSHKGGAED
ncbi:MULTISPECIES: hypothetical protein [unclassified Nocardioides]|uniref:hypothetical protein n=1 Tax=unclassified Nocardioides TaxID=2615069 RepID=UPI0036221913